MPDRNFEEWVRTADVALNTDPLLKSGPPECRVRLWRQNLIARELVPVAAENRVAWDVLRELVFDLVATRQHIAPGLGEWLDLFLNGTPPPNGAGRSRTLLRNRSIVRAIKAVQSSGASRSSACKAVAEVLGEHSWKAVQKVLERYENCEPDVKDMQRRLDDLEHEASLHLSLDRHTVELQLLEHSGLSGTRSLTTGSFTIPNHSIEPAPSGDVSVYRITQPYQARVG